jgi:hypothetical protein
MDISNPDLTKKVLRALSPNDIKSENEFDKQRSIVTKMYPSFGKREDEKRKIAIKQGITESLDKAIEERLIEAENFNLEYLNTINDKEIFLKFIDTIQYTYPKVKNRERGINLYKIMERALELYNTKFIRSPHSTSPLNSDNFDKLFELKEELRKKLYPEPSLAKKTGDALGKTATATRKGVGKAATATRKGVGTAARATGKALGTAATATRKGVGTAATATGKALGTAATATGKALGTAATATGRVLGKAIPNRFKGKQKAAPIIKRTITERLMNNPEEREEFKRQRRLAKQARQTGLVQQAPEASTSTST